MQAYGWEVLVYPIRAAVCGCIIDQDDLILPAQLGLQGFQAGRQVLHAVVRNDDSTDRCSYRRRAILHTLLSEDHLGWSPGGSNCDSPGKRMINDITNTAVGHN